MLENLETVLARITVPEYFQLFAGEQDKIEYGRKWLIEDTTPISRRISQSDRLFTPGLTCIA